MVIATDLQPLGHRLLVWQAYDPSAKVDLVSSALFTDRGTVVIDPVPLNDISLAQLHDAGPIAGVIVTNRNHVRAAADFSARFSIPIFAHPDSYPEEKPPQFTPLRQSTKVFDALEVFEISGAVPGEVALYTAADGGTFIIGDALINFEPSGFTFLPRKYCANEKQMRQSLRQLLAKPSERMLFAHGTPITAQTGVRLRELLGSEA